VLTTSAKGTATKGRFPFVGKQGRQGQSQWQVRVRRGRYKEEKAADTGRGEAATIATSAFHRMRHSHKSRRCHTSMTTMSFTERDDDHEPPASVLTRDFDKRATLTTKLVLTRLCNL
jgi:hypothetical protein